VYSLFPLLILSNNNFGKYQKKSANKEQGSLFCRFEIVKEGKCKFGAEIVRGGERGVVKLKIRVDREMSGRQNFSISKNFNENFY